MSSVTSAGAVRLSKMRGRLNRRLCFDDDDFDEMVATGFVLAARFLSIV